MAVHVVLDQEQVRSILSLYHLDGLEEFGGIAEGSINSAYWVKVDGTRYFLRITEGKTIDDMIFEKKVLLRLQEANLSVPILKTNVAQGTFTPWSEKGRYVSLFEYMPGRELGVFEVSPEHCAALGDFAARMHQALAGENLNRANEFNIKALGTKLERLQRALEKGKLFDGLKEDLDFLEANLSELSQRDISELPKGIVHGDLFIDNVKFKDDQLVGVIDFEMASYERLIWELAVAINAWCWQPSADQHGQPAGTFSTERARALMEAYQEARPLEDDELSALAGELRLAAARFTVTRIWDFELNQLPADQRVYKDYRHFMARLRALSDGGAEALLAALAKD